jgi:membrane protease YdiL (CAAX protease family)
MEPVPHTAGSTSSGEIESPKPPEPALSSVSPGAGLTIYIAIEVLSITLLGAMPTELNGAYLTSSPFPWLMFLQEALLFGAALLPAWLLARFEHRPAGDYGLPLGELFGRRFWQGCLLGLAEVSLLVGSIALFGGYRFGTLALAGPGAVVAWLFFWFAFFLVVGLYEEFLFRGYVQFTLTRAVRFWPAAWILSLGFGALHLMNSGENWVGVAGVAVAGLVFALALRRTGNLWLAVGWHAAFDFGETFLYSVPNSGALLRGHLSNAHLEGPAWLTGGSVGPEGSVFSFLIMGASALAIHLIFPQNRYRAGLPAAPVQRTSSETSTS